MIFSAEAHRLLLVEIGKEAYRFCALQHVDHPIQVRTAWSPFAERVAELIETNDLQGQVMGQKGASKLLKSDRFHVAEVLVMCVPLASEGVLFSWSRRRKDAGSEDDML